MSIFVGVRWNVLASNYGIFSIRAQILASVFLFVLANSDPRLSAVPLGPRASMVILSFDSNLGFPLASHFTEDFSESLQKWEVLLTQQLGTTKW